MLINIGKSWIEYVYPKMPFILTEPFFIYKAILTLACPFPLNIFYKKIIHNFSANKDKKKL